MIEMMNYGVVVALSGWVLLVPPTATGPDGKPGKFDLTAPLNGWTQLRAYDSATECEKDKRGRIDSIMTLHLPSPHIPEALAKFRENLVRKHNPNARFDPNSHSLKDDIDWVLNYADEEERTITPELRAQREQWYRDSEAWRQEAVGVQAAMRPLVDLLERAKCVPADAVYQAPK